jgi:flagellar export protein FliJ
MRKFEFSLQKLLDVQEAYEKAAEQKLAAARKLLHSAQEELKRLRSKMDKEIAAIETFKGTQTARHNLMSHVKYLEKLQYIVAQQSQRVAECQIEVDKCMELLHQIMRKRKTLEKLKEREKALWQEEEKKTEQKQLDEFAVIGHYRASINAPMEFIKHHIYGEKT